MSAGRLHIAFIYCNISRRDSPVPSTRWSLESIDCFAVCSGYQLGDNDQWSKVTNFEHAVRSKAASRFSIEPTTRGLLFQRCACSALALTVLYLQTRIPLLIKPAAGTAEAAASAGRRALGLVESVDIMPSLVELAIPGRVLHKCPPTLDGSRATMLCTDGVPSLLTALRDPTAELNPGAFSQIPRDKLVQGMSGAGGGPHELFMGYTVRTSEWRFTEWHPFNATLGIVDRDTLVGSELYYHGDADGQSADCSWDYESENVAGTNSSVEKVEKKLAAMLRTIVAG